MGMDYFIRTCGDLERMIREVGVVPFFRNKVTGWSVEEHIDRAVWFTDQDGPWEWKGPLAFEKKCAYGKLIRNKTAFVSLEWFPDLANWRREGYGFDARVDEGLAPYRDRLLMDWLSAHPCSLSSEAKRGCGFTEGYDAVLTRLEMQTYVLNADFRYSIDRHGRPYGWGSAVLCPTDDWLDEAQRAAPEGRSPAESFERLFGHLRALMPEADEETLRRELK